MLVKTHKTRYSNKIKLKKEIHLKQVISTQIDETMIPTKGPLRDKRQVNIAKNARVFPMSCFRFLFFLNNFSHIAASNVYIIAEGI